MEQGMRFSPSSLKLFEDCPRCFWLKHNASIERPRGIMASVTKGIDKAMKALVDSQVADGAQVDYLLTVPGATAFVDPLVMKKLKSWRTFQAPVQCGAHLVGLSGELDALIFYPETRLYEPWDFKSNGSERNWEEYSQKYNQTQADMYDAVLLEMGFKTTGFAAFTFSWPKPEDGMQFSWATVRIPTNLPRLRAVAESAIDCLLEAIPLPAADCEYCPYVQQLLDLKLVIEKAAFDVPEEQHELPMDEAPAIIQALAPKRRTKGKI